MRCGLHTYTPCNYCVGVRTALNGQQDSRVSSATHSHTHTRTVYTCDSGERNVVVSCEYILEEAAKGVLWACCGHSTDNRHSVQIYGSWESFERGRV